MNIKRKLLDALTEELTNRDVEDADEIADTVVDRLDEDGVFDTESDDE